MTIFSKIDKKVLAILIVIVLFIVLAGFAVYKYVVSSGENVKNLTGGAQIEVGNIKVEGGDSGATGGLSVCMDKCGDGICQKVISDCSENKLNCVCPESLGDCPEDCK